MQKMISLNIHSTTILGDFKEENAVNSEIEIECGGRGEEVKCKGRDRDRDKDFIGLI